MFFSNVRLPHQGAKRNTPLHLVVRLALSCCIGTYSCELPEVVQLVLDTGGYIHDRAECGITPLQCLLS